MAGDLSPQKILDVGLGFWASKALLSAVEMGLFTELAKHPEELGPPQELPGKARWPVTGNRDETLNSG